MLIKNISVKGSGGFNLLAVREDQELAPKLESLSFDATPVGLTPLKVLVAGALLFGNREMDRIETIGEVPKGTVERVQSLLGIGINPTMGQNLGSVESDESDTTIKATTLKINLEGSFTANTPGRDVTTLSLIPSERCSGVLWGVKEAIVASNAWLHEKYDSRSRLVAAVGVLFAEEFLAEAICVPSTTETEANFIRELCKIVGINAIFEGELC
ncbi:MULTISPECIES: hypothetical protein [unclassified Arthrobacter]|uniref:hypothetical protein n=1 Tax=unclassified Arthrobacter TaxID=235627 RepID=UPI0011B0DC43|nr:MULTISPECIES: hypothetical protein [unclassified Arthrobacter]